MKLFFCLSLATLVFFSCKKKDPTPPSPTPTPLPTVPLITMPAGWKFSNIYNSNLATGIQAYTFDSTFAGRKTRAFCLVVDNSTNRFDFKPVLNNATRTPSQFFIQEPGVTYACINGGYFGSGQSYSIVQYGSAILSANVKQVSRTFNGASTPYFPTRAAIGINSNG